MFFYIFYLFLLIGIVLQILNKKYNLLALCKRVRTVNGEPFNKCAVVIPGKSIFGNNLDIISLNPEKLFYINREYVKYSNGQNYFEFFIGSPVYNIVKAEDAEWFLNSQTLLNKGEVYNLIQPFLGSGLLISHGKKWHSRRRLLTPAFHFNILQRFLETFKDETNKFMNILSSKRENEVISLNEVIPKFTLNNICETALGVNLDDINQSAEYRNNIMAAEQYFLKRVCNPLMHFDIVYNRFKDSKDNSATIKKLNDFSSNIIEKRRETFEVKDNSFGDHTEENYYFRKKRHAMLDTLLEAESKNLIDHPGICEEVDTFMFEGFDTTSSGLMYILALLGTHQDVQQKCYEEIKTIKDDLSELSVQDFSNLKYLECAIKESFRLYPPVPFVGRTCHEETVYKNYIFPIGTDINIHIFDIHRDPEHFPEPEKFDPERFFPENSINRHSFAFIPFSAGPRNCIGQKFALLEIKVLLVNLLLNYKIDAITKLDEIVFESGLVLRSKNPIKVKMSKRK